MRQEKEWFPAYSATMPGLFLILLLCALAVFTIALFHAMQGSIGPRERSKELSAGAELYQQKRYEEAMCVFRSLLIRRLPAGFEADTRRRLADTLDILGKPDEAASERERANALSMSNGRDSKALATQGDLLRREHRHDEACELYQRALSLMPPRQSPERAHVMAKLALAHHGAGHLTQTVRWAEESLASRPSSIIRLIMHRMAGVGYSEQGKLEEAEAHYRRALELAEAAEDAKEIGRSLSTLAMVQLKRGQFEEAIMASRRAMEMFNDPNGTPLLTEAECLRNMGRFDEALAVMRRYHAGPPTDEPWMERRRQALGALGCAWIEANADQPDAALVSLEKARRGLRAVESPSVWPPSPGGNDDRILLWCDATTARVQAQLGRTDEARRLVDSVLSRLTQFPEDRATRTGAYGQLGRAAFLLGDLAASRDFWLCYLDDRSGPVSLATAHYHLGEISLRLSEADAAREAFRQAVAPGIDSLDARRAQSRLDELGG